MKKQTDRGSARNTNLRHCSNKYNLAREGDKDKEKDEDFEKMKEVLFFGGMKSSSVERDEFSVVA